MTRLLTICLVITLALAGCDTIDLYDRAVGISGHAWRSSEKPVFRFNIKDTTVPYQLYVLLRHSSRYNYNNLWINLHTVAPDGSTNTAQYELPLAASEKGWLGTGMEDIYEHRIALTPVNQDFRFSRAGTYTFTIEHIMRENPLQEVYNVGLRVEKKKAR
jgi:gliding motility-associated lipoprotein GldH